MTDNTFTDTATLEGVVGTLTGAFDITGFEVQDGELVAVGSLTDLVFTPTGGTPIDLADITNVVFPVLSGTTNDACSILDLTLGPLDLDLLGLVVELDTVDLEITAQRGPGNLLGNLLCSVTGLLDGNGLNGLANLLNNLLRL